MRIDALELPKKRASWPRPVRVICDQLEIVEKLQIALYAGTLTTVKDLAIFMNT